MDNGSGAVRLATDGGLTDITFLGIAVHGIGSVTGSANDDTDVAIFIVGDQDLIWAKVSTGTIAVWSVGKVFDLETEVGIDQTDTTFGTRGIGFHVLAYDATNAMALGRFIRGAS